jgi:hypothetical protein
MRATFPLFAPVSHSSGRESRGEYVTARGCFEDFTEECEGAAAGDTAETGSIHMKAKIRSDEIRDNDSITAHAP